MKKTAWLVVLIATIVALGAANATTSVALPEYGDGCSCHGGNPPAPSDTTAPVTTSNAQTSYVDSASITLTATDGGSGVAATYYTVNGGAQSSGTTVSLVGAGSYTLRFWSVDSAGNTESAQTASVTITASVVTPPSPTNPAARTATIKADDSSVRRGERIKLEGSVSAAATGERAELWVLAPGSTKWVLASTAGIEVKAAKVASASRYSDDDDDDDDHAVAAASSVGTGKWSARITGAIKGTYQFQVRVAATSSYTSATSRTVSVRVK